MDNNKNYSKLALEATDLDYQDKASLSRIFGFSAITKFWEEVMEYRQDFKKVLPLKLLNGYPLYLIATKTLLGKWDNISDSIESTISSLGTSLNEKARKEVRKSLYLSSLKAIKELEGIEVSELSLKAMINGTYAETDPAHKVLLGYLRCLDSYSTFEGGTPDEDFLADALMKLRNEPELTSFYREGTELDRRRPPYYSFAQEKAPDGHVEEYMGPFLAFIKDNPYPPFVSLGAILFYMPLISPFAKENLSTTVLLAKAYLAKLYGKEAFYLPIERLLLNDASLLSASKNVRSSGDLTFLLSAYNKVLEKLLFETQETIKNASIAVYSPEYNQLSEEEKTLASQIGREEKKEEAKEVFSGEIINRKEQEALSDKAISKEAEPLENKTPETNPLEEEVVEETHASEDISKPLSEKEKPFEDIEEDKEQELSSEKEVSLKLDSEKTATPEKKIGALPKNKTLSKPTLSPSKTITEKEMVETSKGVAAPSFELDVLSEKEAKEYMRYLLETNPNLNKKQASFLSTHCTPGRFYSIQQFKTFTHCVYETARTSMDKLALEGYYEKLQVKNKFVYTPKRKGDSK